MPVRGHRGLVAVVVTLANMVTMFFWTSLSIVVPLISEELGCSLETAAWVTIAPGFVSCMLVPAIGKLADQRNCRARLFWLGYFLHIGGLLAAAVAPGIGTLLAARCLTGLASSCISPTGFALMVRGVPPVRRGQIAAVQEAVQVISPSVGMVVGGWVADHIGWRMLMLAPLPFVAAIFAASLLVIPFDSQLRREQVEQQAQEDLAVLIKRLASMGEPEPEGREEGVKGGGGLVGAAGPRERAEQPFDWRGAAVFAGAMGCLLFAVTKGNDYGWASVTVGTCGAGALALFALLILVEHRAAEAIFSRRLFADPVVPLSIGMLVFTDMCYMGAFLAVPMYLTQARGLTMTEAAELVFIRPGIGSVCAIVLAKLMGGAVSNLSLTTAGCGFSVLAYGFARAVLVPSTGDPAAFTVTFMVLQACSGFFVFLPVNGLVLERVHERDLSNMQAVVSMATNTASNFGMAVGVALVRASGDRHDPASFGATFSAFLACAVGLLPLMVTLQFAARRGDRAGGGRAAAQYAPLAADG
jgi:MFS family permease